MIRSPRRPGTSPPGTDRRVYSASATAAVISGGQRGHGPPASLSWGHAECGHGEYGCLDTVGCSESALRASAKRSSAPPEKAVTRPSRAAPPPLGRGPHGRRGGKRPTHPWRRRLRSLPRDRVPPYHYHYTSGTRVRRPWAIVRPAGYPKSPRCARKRPPEPRHRLRHVRSSHRSALRPARCSTHSKPMRN